MRVALVDADVLLYEVASSTEYVAQWDEWLWTTWGDLGEAQIKLDEKLRRIAVGLDAERLILAVTDSTNWRKEVMPTYKHNRVSKRKPVLFKALREYAAENYEVHTKPGLEGDDILGILATHPLLVPGQKIVVSIDKDMKTVPGFHVNLNKVGEDEDWEQHIEFVSTADADYFHLFQTLTGDVTDGYPGCPGVGPVSAEKLLKTPALYNEESDYYDVPAAWDVIVAAYAKKGLSEEVALQNARVARICRASEWDKKKQRVVLWTPTREAVSDE